MRVSIRRAESVTLAAHRGAIRRADLGALCCAAAATRSASAARASLAVRLTDDDELRALNARFLGIDTPTDVLAFPAGEPDRVGDIAISVERALDQAAGRRRRRRAAPARRARPAPLPGSRPWHAADRPPR